LGDLAIDGKVTVSWKIRYERVDLIKLAGFCEISNEYAGSVRDINLPISRVIVCFS
jgi:hypothetical protein